MSRLLKTTLGTALLAAGLGLTGPGCSPNEPPAPATGKMEPSGKLEPGKMEPGKMEPSGKM